MRQTGCSLQTPIATAIAGGSVQPGLSAAGGVYGFFEHYSAADKRWSFNRTITGKLLMPEIAIQLELAIQPNHDSASAHTAGNKERGS